MERALDEIRQLRDRLVRRSEQLDQRENSLMRENERLVETVALLRKEKAELKNELNSSQNMMMNKEVNIAKLNRQLLIERSRHERIKENVKPVEVKAPKAVPSKTQVKQKKNDFDDLGLLSTKILAEALLCTNDTVRACDWLIRLARRIGHYWRHYEPIRNQQMEASFDLANQMISFYFSNQNEHAKLALAQLSSLIYQLKVDSSLSLKHLILCLKFVTITPRGSKQLIPKLKRLQVSQLDSGDELARTAMDALNFTETRSLVDHLGHIVFEIVKSFGLINWTKADRNRALNFCSKIYQNRRTMTFDVKACLLILADSTDNREKVQMYIKNL